MSDRPALPDVFGNYAIRGLEEIIAADPVSWWPQTPGWKALLLVAFLLLARWCWQRARRWWDNAYRRAALVQLRDLSQQAPNPQRLTAVAALLKATAIAAGSRTELAALSGQSWVSWLEGSTTRTLFSESSKELLAEGVYRDPGGIEPAALTQLMREVESWICQHPEPRHE